MVSGLDPAREERQGKALDDAAVSNSVTHFVYSSVGRHGNQSDDNPTNVPHFKSKFGIEQHLTPTLQRTRGYYQPHDVHHSCLPIFMETSQIIS